MALYYMVQYSTSILGSRYIPIEQARGMERMPSNQMAPIQRSPSVPWQIGGFDRFQTIFSIKYVSIHQCFF